MNDNTVTINGKEFSVPEPVLELMIMISKERDYYKSLLNPTQPNELIN